MQGAHVLVRPNKADLDASSWAQEWAKLFGTDRQIPEPIGPILTTTLLGRGLLQEMLVPLPDLWVPISCSGKAQHFGDVLPNPWLFLSGTRLLMESRLQPVKGTRREHAELFFPPINLIVFSLNYVNPKLHESNCYNWLKLVSKLMTLRQCCKQLTHYQKSLTRIQLIYQYYHHKSMKFLCEVLQHCLSTYWGDTHTNAEVSDIAYISSASLVSKDATNRLYLGSTERLLSTYLWLT